jgi:hypothetical protein
MKQLNYRPVDGVTVMYDIIENDDLAGIVWQTGGKWYADRTSMATPAASGETREEAAEKLISL